MYKQHSQLSQLLDNRTNLDRDRYFRLVVISTASTVCLLPLGLYSLITRSLKVYPWPGLTDVHAFISEVYVVPATTWRATQNSQYTVEIFRWEFVFGAFVIFACFGVHREARMDYTSAVRSILRLKRCVIFLTMHTWCRADCVLASLDHLQPTTQNLHRRRSLPWFSLSGPPGENLDSLTSRLTKHGSSLTSAALCLSLKILLLLHPRAVISETKKRGTTGHGHQL